MKLSDKEKEKLGNWALAMFSGSSWPVKFLVIILGGAGLSVLAYLAAMVKAGV